MAVRSLWLPIAVALPCVSAVAMTPRSISSAETRGTDSRFINVEVNRPPVKVFGVGLFMDNVGLYVDGVGMIMDPVRATIEETANKWKQLQDLLGTTGASDANEEAARKLITNHEAVLRDMTNTIPSPTQPDLSRLGMFDALFIDQALREVSRRLLGRREPEEQLDPTMLGQAKAWAQAAEYLDRRLQMSSNECIGRQPDMSVAAASAMRAVLRELGGMAQAA